jgi:Sulfotransferase domain
MTQFYFHVGYPKTGTTTLQGNLFPFHSQIDYLGKYIPSFWYRDDRLFSLIDELTTSGKLFWETGDLLSGILAGYRSASVKPAILISTESFLHVSAVDIGAAADRLKSLVPDARIIITIRNQLDLLESFFWNHGAFGQYLFLAKELDKNIRLPLCMSEWLEYQFGSMGNNMLPTLLFDKVVSCYWGLFGRENVCLLMQEEFRTEPAHFVCALAKFMGIDAEEAVTLTRGRWDNPRLSDQEAEFLKLKLRFGIDRPPNRAIATILRWMAKSKAANAPNLTLIQEPWSTKLRSLFEASNRKLETMSGLPLKQRGYP